MNKRRVFGAVLLVVVMLLVSVVPASAGTQRVHVTGECIFESFVAGDDFRAWYSGQIQYHQRDALFGWRCDFTDERLDGMWWGNANGDAKEYYTDEGDDYQIGNTRGWMRAEDAYGNTMWDGSQHGVWRPEGYRESAILHGQGDFAGLKVELELWGSIGDWWPWVMYAEGEILEPGN